MQIKEEYVLARIKKTYFIAEDGVKFNTKIECEAHETEYFRKHNTPVFKTAVHNIYDPLNDCQASLYNIQSEEDWRLLVECEWYNNQDLKQYPGAGQYIAICHNGGDYADDYTIIDAQTYIDECMDEVTKFYTKIHNNIKKFKGE